jgi:hypothetical protein
MALRRSGTPRTTNAARQPRSLLAVTAAAAAGVLTLAAAACGSPSSDGVKDEPGVAGSIGVAGSQTDPAQAGEDSGGSTSTGGKSMTGGSAGKSSTGPSTPADSTPATAADVEAQRPECMDYCHSSLVDSNGDPTCPGGTLTERECQDECLAGSFECLMAKRRQHICDMGSSSVKCSTDDKGDPTFTWESEQCSMYAQLTTFACAAVTTDDMMSPKQVQTFAETCDEYCTKSGALHCLSDQTSLCRDQCMRGEVDCLRAKLDEYTCELKNAEPACVVDPVDDYEYPSWTDPACKEQVTTMENACPFEVRLPQHVDG